MNATNPTRHARPLIARRGRALIASTDGQATVEVVALLPLLLVVTLAGAALLASQAAGEQAGQAAEAGAVALLQGGDARAAARRALPERVRPRALITVRGRRVTVRVRPRFAAAALERRFAAEATADAGPEARP